MSDKRANFDTELPHFQQLWHKRGSSKTVHTSELWDKRAEEWIDKLGNEGNDGGEDATAERVKAIASYLRMHGLLKEGDSVADVGCGPGLFVMEFAKTAKCAVGIDFSERFVRYGNELAIKAGVENVSFLQHDMLELDVVEAGLSKSFDLVFSSITPAVTGEQCLHKLVEMSRAMCCNVSFVNVSDSLLSAVSGELFGGKLNRRHDGMGFYSLFNLLLLSGYYPQTYYHTVETNEQVIPGRRLAEEVAFNLRLDSPRDVERILKYLEENSELTRRRVSRYGCILWDVRICDKQE